MRNVAIVGAGMPPFAEHFELGIKDLVPMAYAEAVANVDKGIQKSEIEAAWFGELSTTDGFPSGILADTLDLTDIPVTRIENACATGNDAIRHGVMAIASGLYDVVLVVGAEGKGLSRLVAQTCDLTVRIPLSSSVESLNASVATGIALAEVARRRRAS